MGKSSVITAILCVLLASCAGQGNIPTPLPPTVAQPSPAATATPTNEPPTKPPPTPTVTPLPPYPNKKVIFEYYTVGHHSYFDPFFVQGFRELPQLVLYEDGLLIVVRDSYRQKVLSPDQVKRLFAKLKALGFYSLESNGKYDPTDKLYNYGNNYQISHDGLKECIYVKADQERTLCAYVPDMQYLVPGMQRILRYLDTYEPAGLTPYYPDRILLWAEGLRIPANYTWPATAVPWGNDLPDLNSLPWGDFSPFGEVPLEQISYFDGPTAKAIYLFLDGSTVADKRVVQGGQEYIVYIEIILPHQELTNAYK